jgi:hypothetical protein
MKTIKASLERLLSLLDGTKGSTNMDTHFTLVPSHRLPLSVREIAQNHERENRRKEIQEYYKLFGSAKSHGCIAADIKSDEPVALRSPQTETKIDAKLLRDERDRLSNDVSFLPTMLLQLDDESQSNDTESMPAQLDDELQQQRQETTSISDDNDVNVLIAVGVDNHVERTSAIPDVIELNPFLILLNGLDENYEANKKAILIRSNTSLPFHTIKCISI